MKFKACMFDFDGTLTKKGVNVPDFEMVDILFALSKKVPVAFCTGRAIGSFVHGSFAVLLEGIEEKKRLNFLKNLFLFVENGSIGYEFDSKKSTFAELYRVEWPDHFIKKSELKIKLLPRISEFGELFSEGHEVGFVIQAKSKTWKENDIDHIYSLSAKIYDICVDFFSEISSDFEKYLRIGNSGIGVVIGPADGDKDSAIKKFAKILEEKRGIKFDSRASEILVVGDSPLPSGNDFYFLDGKYGTPFTVGEDIPKNEFPKTIKPFTDKKLYNDDATKFLIKTFFDV